MASKHLFHRFHYHLLPTLRRLAFQNAIYIWFLSFSWKISFTWTIVSGVALALLCTSLKISTRPSMLIYCKADVPSRRLLLSGVPKSNCGMLFKDRALVDNHRHCSPRKFTALNDKRCDSQLCYVYQVAGLSARSSRVAGHQSMECVPFDQVVDKIDGSLVYLKSFFTTHPVK